MERFPEKDHLNNLSLYIYKYSSLQSIFPSTLGFVLFLVSGLFVVWGEGGGLFGGFFLFLGGGGN